MGRGRKRVTKRDVAWLALVVVITNYVRYGGRVWRWQVLP